jgi:hypothetical protein
MPNRRFDWHVHIKDVEGEYQAARFAIDLVKVGLVATPDLMKRDDEARSYLRDADRNLEGTYLVRLFAAFEAALRSYDRARHNDPTRKKDASVLIDETGGRRGQGISTAVREGAHAVRRVRNYWAHEDDATPEPMTISDARARLQTYLSWLPEEWG